MLYKSLFIVIVLSFFSPSYCSSSSSSSWASGSTALAEKEKASKAAALNIGIAFSHKQAEDLTFIQKQYQTQIYKKMAARAQEYIKNKILLPALFDVVTYDALNAKGGLERPSSYSQLPVNEDELKAFCASKQTILHVSVPHKTAIAFRGTALPGIRHGTLYTLHLTWDYLTKVPILLSTSTSPLPAKK